MRRQTIAPIPCIPRTHSEIDGWNYVVGCEHHIVCVHHIYREYNIVREYRSRSGLFFEVNDVGLNATLACANSHIPCVVNFMTVEFRYIHVQRHS